MEMTEEQREAVRRQFGDILSATLDECVEKNLTTAQAMEVSRQRLVGAGIEHGLERPILRADIYLGSAFGVYSSNGKPMTPERADKIMENARTVASTAVICPEKPGKAYQQ